MIKSTSLLLQKSNGEVLLVKRNQKLKSFAGLWSFVGGKIEDKLSNDWSGNEDIVKLNLLREVYEELGICFEGKVYPREDRNKKVTEIYSKEFLEEFLPKLKFIGRRQTPPFTKRQFDNAYFLLTEKDFPPLSEIEVIVDGSEIVDSTWIKISEAIEQFTKLELNIPPPILRILEVMNEFPENFIEVLIQDSAKPVGIQTPIKFAPNVEHIPLKSKTAHPFICTNFTLFRGSKHTVMVDPGWIEEVNEDAQIILETIKDEEPFVVISHHHHDHIDGLKFLATKFPKATVIASEFTLSQITTNLNKIAMEEGIIKLGKGLEDRDWHLEIVYTPGHTIGHISVYDPLNKLLVAGDHMVGIGTALLDPRTGDIGDYLNTIEKLKKLNLHLILPAHGPTIYTPYETLEFYKKHRLERENQIILLLNEREFTPSELVDKIYAGLNPNSKRYASFNVHLHLKKLLDEGRVKVVNDEQITIENFANISYKLAD